MLLAGMLPVADALAETGGTEFLVDNVVGGIGSIIGTLVVAHIVGFLEVIVVATLAPELRGVFTMLLIIGVLVTRPQGLFGREEL